jgi:hypothetical protein
MLDSFFSLIQRLGLPVAICVIVLFRVDHYIGRLLDIFDSLSVSLRDLTAEIKSLKRCLNLRENYENCQPRRPE